MNKKLVFGTLALIMGIGAITAISAGSALAYKGDPSVKGPNYSLDRHENMLKAFKNSDYSAWKDLMQGRGRVSNIINEDNFGKFALAHQLSLEGKLEEAKQIRQELGLNRQNSVGRNGDGTGMRRGFNW